jgi:uncharacterized protein (DUF4415 family)
MPGKKQSTPPRWIDPDDAPELTDEMVARATLTVGGEEVSRAAFDTAVQVDQARRSGRPRAIRPKVSTTIRFDAELLAAIKATGPGWQTRVNDALRADVKAGRLKQR